MAGDGILDPEEETPDGGELEAPKPKAAEVDWQARAEMFERKFRRHERFEAVREKYPHVKLSDFDHIDPKGWEKQAELLEKIAAAAAAPQPSGDTEPATPAPSAEAVEAAKAFTAGAGGSGPAATKTYSAKEVGEIGLRDQAEALRIIAAGQMRSPDK